MNDITLTIRTADQTRKAEIEIDLGSTGADVIEAAVGNWNLPTDTDYSIVNITKGDTLQPQKSLGDSQVEDGNVLEIQPVLVAG